jgi:hypothetical protein
MANELLRNTIGVRNPYAVAELKSGKKINWDKKSQEEKIKLLEQAFGRPYGELFDPLYGSSLFPSSQKQPSELPRTGAGDTVSCTPNPCPAMDDWLSVPNGIFYKDKTTYDDLIQGCLPDCYFIAALSALAWATMSQSEFQTTLESCNNGFSFYSPKTDSSGTIIIDGAPDKDPDFKVTDKIPLIKPGTKIYSRSNTEGETWPCIYEKAYATWCDCKKKQIQPGPDVNPDYLSICQGNPLTALIHLKGKKCVSRETKNMSSGDCYFKIGTQTTPSVDPAKTKSVTDKTSYPTVAWTYGSAPDGVSYSNDVIVANHSYTVLGVYPRIIPADDKKYIVLRNPFGQKTGDPKRGVDPNLPADAFFDGVWLPLGKDAAGSYRKLNDPLDGIFALKDSVFKKYFAGFGWAIY